MANGLLDFFATPMGQGLLSAGFGAAAGARRGQPWNTLGRGGLAGLAGYSQTIDRQNQEAERSELMKDRETNRAFRQAQMDRLYAEQAREAAQRQWMEGLPAAMQQAQGQQYQLNDPLGDGVYSGQASTPADPKALQSYLMRPESPFANKLLEQQLFPKAPDYKVVGGSLVQVGPDGVKPVYETPEKPEALPSDVRMYNFARQNDGYQGSFTDWLRQNRRAGAPSVSVNTGQNGFDNTLKLRGDFRSEPIYKAFQEMETSYAQIREGLGKASPAGDLAGATKIMKLLDPGSVVRESELGMAMAATGALDRVSNYAQMVINGTKLTPDQRKDFQSLADALYAESVKQYNAKRNEYVGIAERNQLSVEDVVGKERTPPAKPKADRKVVRTGTLNGRKVVEYEDGSVDYAD